MVKPKYEMNFPWRRMTEPLCRAVTRARPMTSSTTTVNLGEANTKILVRVRPRTEKEMGDNQRIVVKIMDDHLATYSPIEDSHPFFFCHAVQRNSWDMLKKVNQHMQFVFDRLFGCEFSNNGVFENSI